MTEGAIGIWSLILVLAGCSSAPIPLVQDEVFLKGVPFEVEVAQFASQQRQGLQHRTCLASNRGMLFVYPSAQPRRFWMKDTLIPLDILFFDSSGRFINGHFSVPPCASGTRCPFYRSARPARYVLEVAAGRSYGLGLKAGAKALRGAALGNLANSDIRP